jgi:predicted transcriptional regulator
MNALELFKRGNDYLAIAALLHISEAEVEREIHRLRNEEREQAAEKKRAYKRQWAREKKAKQSEPSKLIRYAGYEGERA